MSVFTGEVFAADVAIADGHVVGVGGYSGPDERDVSGKYLVPGFMDGHCHVESSKLSVAEFATAILRSGTTTVVVDPHELANVLGVAGIEYVLAASANVPMNVFVMIPSCVPASPFESPNAELRVEDFVHLLDEPRVIGIAEMMNYPAVLSGDATTLAKLAATGWRRIDGHAPGLTGNLLNAYLAAGPSTDHEATTLEEALEKRRLGMWVMIREASMIRNLKDLLPLVKQYGTEQTLFVTDDREVDTLLHEGHINAMVRLAVANGLSPADAVKLATLNVARCHGLEGLGAIAPGYRADICVLPDLQSFIPELVLKDGDIVAEGGEVKAFPTGPTPPNVLDTVRLPVLHASEFHVPATEDTGSIRVVELVKNQVVTRSMQVQPTIRNGVIVADQLEDLAKLGVVERHHGTGQVGIGFVRGFHLQHGAFASSVAHDAHNIVVVGMNDEDMALAVQRLGQIGGGLAVAVDGQIKAELTLPIAGLMSDLPAEEVDKSIRTLDAALGDLGVTLPTPFMYISFLALSVIPEIRVTNQGIVDVNRFAIVPLVIQ